MSEGEGREDKGGGSARGNGVKDVCMSNTVW